MVFLSKTSSSFSYATLITLGFGRFLSIFVGIFRLWYWCWSIFDEVYRRRGTHSVESFWKCLSFIATSSSFLFLLSPFLPLWWLFLVVNVISWLMFSFPSFLEDLSFQLWQIIIRIYAFWDMHLRYAFEIWIYRKSFLNIFYILMKVLAPALCYSFLIFYHFTIFFYCWLVTVVSMCCLFVKFP